MVVSIFLPHFMQPWGLDRSSNVFKCIILQSISRFKFWVCILTFPNCFVLLIFQMEHPHLSLRYFCYLIISYFKASKDHFLSKITSLTSFKHFKLILSDFLNFNLFIIVNHRLRGRFGVSAKSFNHEMPKTLLPRKPKTAKIGCQELWNMLWLLSNQSELLNILH